jgi:hypothetical protein
MLASLEKSIPKSTKMRTIYYQGIYSSQTQLAKYLHPETGFIGTTGEKVTCSRGLDVILNPYIGQEIDEIELYDGRIINWFNPLRVLSYLFVWLGQIVNYVRVERTVTNTNLSLRYHFINLFKFNFGQQGDGSNHLNKYLNCRAEYPDDNIILWGVSKGAATTLSSLVLNNYDVNRIKMVVLEGCFSSIEDVFKHWVAHRSYTDPNFWIAKLVLFLLKKNMLSWFIRYKHNPEYDPINLVSRLPRDVPVLFITSEIDEVVPADQTIQLYDKLKESGHQKAHLLVLSRSRHPAYMFDDEEDRTRYRKFILDMYKKYGII